MKKYLVIVDYQDSVLTIEAEDEQEALEKASEQAAKIAEINGLRIKEY
ncbi:MAG: hypothetical protein AABX86_03185 [Nanoarchaeota archaeon]